MFSFFIKEKNSIIDIRQNVLNADIVFFFFAQHFAICASLIYFGLTLINTIVLCLFAGEKGVKVELGKPSDAS